MVITMQRLFVNLFLAIMMLCVTCITLAAGNSDPVGNLVKPNVAQAKLKASPLFSGRGDGVTTCPVTGEKVNKKSLKAEFHGRTLYFCCHGCLKAAKKAPDRYIKPSPLEQEKAVKAFLAKAKAIDSAEVCD